jgi:hypothetical protein
LQSGGYLVTARKLLGKSRKSLSQITKATNAKSLRSTRRIALSAEAPNRKNWNVDLFVSALLSLARFWAATQTSHGKIHSQSISPEQSSKILSEKPE